MKSLEKALYMFCLMNVNDFLKLIYSEVAPSILLGNPHDRYSIHENRLVQLAAFYDLNCAYFVDYNHSIEHPSKWTWDIPVLVKPSMIGTISMLINFLRLEREANFQNFSFSEFIFRDLSKKFIFELRRGKSFTIQLITKNQIRDKYVIEMPIIEDLEWTTPFEVTNGDGIYRFTQFLLDEPFYHQSNFNLILKNFNSFLLNNNILESFHYCFDLFLETPTSDYYRNIAKLIYISLSIKGIDGFSYIPSITFRSGKNELSSGGLVVPVFSSSSFLSDSQEVVLFKAIQWWFSQNANADFINLSKAQSGKLILVSLKNSISSILSRNFSHNIGSHVMHNADVSKVVAKLNGKQAEFNREADELNAYRYASALKSLLDRYVVQRNEYLADVSENTMPAGNYARLYAEVLMPFVENFLLTDNIAAAEGIGFPSPDADNRLQIRVFIQADHHLPQRELITVYDLQKQLLQYTETNEPTILSQPSGPDGKAAIVGRNDAVDVHQMIQAGYPNTGEVLWEGAPLRLPYRLPLNVEGTHYLDSGKIRKLIHPKMLEAFFHTRQVKAYDPVSKTPVPDNGVSADVEVALPGVLGHHALYSLLENFIRNSAKHNNESLRISERQLTIKIQLSPLEDEDISSGRFGNRDDAWCVRISDDNLSWLTDEEEGGKGQFQKLQEFINAPLITGQTGEPRTTGLGIADMVVSASVLAGSFDFDFSAQNAANKFFHIERVKQQDGKCTFAYRFYLLKAKRIICLTKRRNPQGKHLGWSRQGITFVRTLEDLYSKLGRQSYRFAVLDADILDEELGNDSEKYETLLRRLPYRVIVKEINSTSDNAIAHHRRILQAQRRLAVYNGEISSELTPKAFQEFCWQQWLKAFFFPSDPLPVQLHLYLEHEHAGWEQMEVKDFGDLLNLRVYHSRKNDFQYQNDRIHLIYDHHGRLMEKLKGKADFVHKDKYAIFDKNSADFPRLLYSDEQTLEMMPYMMAEAAMLRILVMDERVAERADEDADIDARRLESADRQFRKESGVNDSILELAWAGGVYVATHLQINDGEERPIHEKAQQRPHAPKLTMHVLAEAGKSGKIQFYSSLYGNNTQKTIESDKAHFDVLLIHRTILKQIQDNAKSVSEEFDFLRDIKEVIPFVVVDSGGGYPEEIHQEYKGSFKFLPFSFMSEHLLRSRIAKIGLVQLLLGLTEANRESTA